MNKKFSAMLMASVLALGLLSGCSKGGDGAKACARHEGRSEHKNTDAAGHRTTNT